MPAPFYAAAAAEAKKGEQKGGWRTMVAAAGAGAIDCCFTMPMDTMSTQMQLQGYKTPMACTRAILDAKGVLGLYAGFWPFLVQSAAKSSVRFYAFELIASTVDRLSLGDRKANPGFWALVCGLGAGTVESLALTAPTDRVKVLSQALSAQKGGVPITALELIREKGVGTLYTGALATALRQSTSVAMRFFIYGSTARSEWTSCGCLSRRPPAGSSAGLWRLEAALRTREKEALRLLSPRGRGPGPSPHQNSPTSPRLAIQAASRHTCVPRSGTTSARRRRGSPFWRAARAARSRSVSTTRSTSPSRRSRQGSHRASCTPSKRPSASAASSG